MSFLDLFTKWVKSLQESGNDSSLREVRLLCCHVLKKTYEEIYFNPPSHLDDLQREAIDKMVLRRLQQEPLAKILGYKEFLSRPFMTNAFTLDPRPESETFFEALKVFYPDPSSALTLLELGVGTGCLLVSFLLAYEKSQGLGADKSYDALKVAFKNCHTYDLNKRCLLFQADALKDLPCRKVDLIISNPPYIDQETILDKSTLFDPHEALFAPQKGLLFYEYFSKNLKNHLHPGGNLLLEIGYDQQEEVCDLFLKQSWIFKGAFKDLLGHDRIVVFGI